MKAEQEKESKEELEEESPVEETVENEIELRVLKKKNIDSYFTKSEFAEICRFLRLFEGIRNGNYESATFLTVSNEKGNSRLGDESDELDGKEISLQMELERGQEEKKEFDQEVCGGH